jgi:hypothetical protein
MRRRFRAARAAAPPGSRDRAATRRFDDALLEHRRLSVAPDVLHAPDEMLSRDALALVEHVQFPRRDHELAGLDLLGPPTADTAVHVRDPHLVEQADGCGLVEMPLRVEIVGSGRDRLDEPVAVAVGYPRAGGVLDAHAHMNAPPSAMNV